MRFETDNTTRFFSIVGAPYIGERHVDTCSEDIETTGSRRSAHTAALPRPCTSTFWLQDDN